MSRERSSCAPAKESEEVPTAGATPDELTFFQFV